jgi:hypothetical protein
VRNEKTGLCAVHLGRNIVTNAGDDYYAQSAAGETPDNSFGDMELGDSSSSAPAKTSTTSSINLISGTPKTVSATYPLTDDTDTDNSGADTDVLTWTFEWSKADFNSTNITDFIICVNGHGAGAPVLTHGEFTGGAFTKTADDTLKVILNHPFTGS